jgi:glycosyltransferase involved in cell wall biosynthesis
VSGWLGGKMLLGALASLVVGWNKRRAVRLLVKGKKVDVIHQPVPVSPIMPSVMFSMGVPVVIGPMNGGMDYPPGFTNYQSKLTRIVFWLIRHMGVIWNVLIPGKLFASALVVANDRTYQSLPMVLRRKRHIHVVPENGVMLDQICKSSECAKSDNGPFRFVFAGRLLRLKGIDLLIEAMARMGDTDTSLEIIGSGPEEEALKELVIKNGVGDQVKFTKWLPYRDCMEAIAGSDVFVFPSLHDCGGAVVLESMAMGIPVIALNWGGPADYLDADSGVLISPSSRTDIVNGLVAAMTRLSRDPALVNRMGESGRRRVEIKFSWDRKIEEMLGIISSVATHPDASRATLALRSEPR